MVPCFRIGEAQRDQILHDGFNPPPSDVNQEAFEAQLRHTRDEFREFLSQFWQYGIGDGDFFVHTGVEDDHMLCVEISDRRMLDSRLLEVAHAAVIAVAADHCVDFCNAWEYLQNESGEWYPDFNIFVSKDQILLYSECEELLDGLGIRSTIQ